MNKEQASAIMSRLRRNWHFFPHSDIALLQSTVDAYENLSYLVIFFFIMFGNPKSWPGGWWAGLVSFAGVIFIVYLQLQRIKLRKVIKFFQEHGPQKIEEIKDDFSA